MDSQTVRVGSAMLEPLLAVARRDPDGAVRLAAFDVVSRFPLTQDAWRAFWAVIRREIDASAKDPEARARALALAVRIPLVSVRRELRRIAASSDDPAADALSEALAAAGDPSQIVRLLKAVDAGKWGALQWLAAMPLEAEGVTISRIPVPAEDADAEVRLWYALAAARLGEFAALDAFLEGREQEPGMFWGSPGVPYSRIAAMRPVPRAMDERLRAALPAVERLEQHSAARTARIVIWAATGMADADGSPIEAAAPEAGVVAPAAAVATKKQVQAAHAAARDLLRDPAGGAASADLAFLPQSEVAGFLTEVVVRANAMAQELPPNVPANEALGNRMIGLVGLLPRATDWPVAALVVLQLEAARSALDDKQLAWVIARGPAAHAIREIAALVVPDRPTAERLRILDIGACAADELAGRAGSPYRGAAPDAGGAVTGRGPLIDDAELVLMAEAEDGAEEGAGAAAGAAPEDDELGIGPAPAPAAAAPSSPGQIESQINRSAARAEPRQAPSETERFLRGDVYRFRGEQPVAETRGLVRGERHAFDVFIGAEGGAFKADVKVPEHEIDWKDKESVSLQVLLAEPNQWLEPLRGTIELPRSGSSRPHRFTFEPSRVGPFQGRVTLYYEGRVLQTALLETTVVEGAAALAAAPGGMTMRVEAAFRHNLGGLDERRRFDACIVCNHTATRQAALTAAGKDGAYISSLGGLAATIANINQLLTQVAQDAVRYSKGLTTKANAELLCRLAMEGNTLYRHIVLDYVDRSSAAKAIRDANYLQIVTMEPDAIVPLEFIYDYPVPKENAPVCPHAKDALESGACPNTCRPTTTPAERVCPLGFWGLRKVIERHIHVPDLAKPAKVLASEPMTGRDELSLKGGTLVGISQEVESPGDAQLLKTLRKIRKSGVKSVKTWKAWTDAIATDKPVMLVTLPHAEGAASNITLEIGGDTRMSVYIDNSYVHVESAPPPLTVLLGCDTANTADTSAYLRHVGVFRQADSALVLGTIATVLGKYAAGMAERLIECLDEAIKSKPGRFGEALLQAKRAAVAKSEMIGLCLVAFGDADWKILADED